MPIKDPYFGNGFCHQHLTFHLRARQNYIVWNLFDFLSLKKLERPTDLRLERPVIIIQGSHAKKLMNIISTVHDARARIRSKQVEVNTVSILFWISVHLSQRLKWAFLVEICLLPLIICLRRCCLCNLFTFLSSF